MSKNNIGIDATDKEVNRLVQFARSFRGQYILSKALHMSSETLKAFEDKKMVEVAAPSDRADMEYLLKLYPIYVTAKKALAEHVAGVVTEGMTKLKEEE